MECGFTPALEFLPNLTKEMLDQNRSWLHPAALDAEDNLVLCFQSYVIQTGKHNILVGSCIGNDKDEPARPLWNKKKDDAFMRGLAAADLTVNDIDFVLLHASPRRSYRLEHAAGERALGADVPKGFTFSPRPNWISGSRRARRTICRRSSTA